jgi:hypothetical protein
VHEDNTCRVEVGKPEGKSAFGTPKHRWEDNIEMDLKEIVEIGRYGLNSFDEEKGSVAAFCENNKGL